MTHSELIKATLQVINGPEDNDIRETLKAMIVLSAYISLQLLLASVPVILYVLKGNDEIIEKAAWRGHTVMDWLLLPGFMLGCLFVKMLTDE